MGNNTKIFKLPTLSGAERLFADLFGIGSLSEIPTDVEETMENVLQLLSPEEQSIVKMYYWYGWNDGMIAEDLGRSKVYVERTRNSCRTQLKSRACKEYIKHGEKYYRSERAGRLQDEIEFETKEVAKLEKTLEELRNENKRLCECIRKELDRDIPTAEISVLADTDRIPIEELGLSARSYNALSHSRYKTIGDIRSAGKEGMVMVRNLGKKSLAEVDEAIFKLTGIPFIN